MIHISNQTDRIGGPLEISYTITHISPYTIKLVDVKPYTIKLVDVKPYTIKLVDVKPYTISTEKPDYVAVLKITKPRLDNEFVDEQICGMGRPWSMESV